jgi:hypothetical protein
VSRVTANLNRLAPAMSAETACCIAAAFGIRQPNQSNQSTIGAELDPASVERLVNSVHDAMLDNAIDGVDIVSAHDLWGEVCAPTAHIDVALSAMVERGYARRVGGSRRNAYILCRTSAAMEIQVDPAPKKAKRAKKQPGKKAGNVQLTAVQAG